MRVLCVFGQHNYGDWRRGEGYERLNVEIFASPADVKRLLATWRNDYNNQRPHSSLGDDTPAGFAAKELVGTVPSRRQENPAGEAGLPQCVN